MERLLSENDKRLETITTNPVSRNDYPTTFKYKNNPATVKLDARNRSASNHN